MGSPVARNTAWNLLGALLPVPVALICIPLLVKALGVERFGVLGLAWMALGYFGMFDFGLAQSTTSTHLACLRDCGLVSARTVGRSSMYSLAVPAELNGLLAAAERLLAVTGDAVTLCPTNHDPDPSEDTVALAGHPRGGRHD